VGVRLRGLRAVPTEKKCFLFMKEGPVEFTIERAGNHKKLAYPELTPESFNFMLCKVDSIIAVEQKL